MPRDRDTDHFPVRDADSAPPRDSGEVGAPPVLEVLDSAWRDTAILFAQRSPRHALSLATMLEKMFNGPMDDELRSDAAKLAAWLRSTVKG